jgi:hypothetical protein
MPTEVREILKAAWSEVEDAGLPPEIRPAAFREAVRLIAPVERRGSSTGPPTRDHTKTVGTAVSSDDSTNGDRSGSPTEDEIYDRVVEHTGVDRARLERLVHLDDDGLRVSIPGLRLGSNTADRARAVARLLTITRGFGLEEAETPLEILRAECIRLKVYDSKNFSTQIARLEGYVLGGSAQNRRLRAKSPGIQDFAAFVETLLPDS